MHDNLEVYLSQKYQIMCSYLNFNHFNGHVICRHNVISVDTIISYMSVHICQFLNFFFFLITQNQSAAGNVIQLIKKRKALDFIVNN